MCNPPLKFSSKRLFMSSTLRMHFYTRQFRMDFSPSRNPSSKVLIRDSEGWYFEMNTAEVNAPSSSTSSSSWRGNDLVSESEYRSQGSGSITDTQSVISDVGRILQRPNLVSAPVSPAVSSPVSPPWESRPTTGEDAARVLNETDAPIRLVEPKPSMSDTDSKPVGFASPTGSDLQQKDPLDGSHDENGRSDVLGPRTWLVDVQNFFTRHNFVYALDCDGPENPDLNNDRFITFRKDAIGTLSHLLFLTRVLLKLWTMFSSKSIAIAAGKFALSVGIFALARYQAPKQVRVGHK
ncbi:hypothetical protein GGU11DRAFT_761394, partial [Lentinula aff. detonsa]